MEVNCKGIDDCNRITTQPKYIFTYSLTKLLRGIYKFPLGHSFVYFNMKNTQYLVAVMIIQSATN